MPSPETAIAYLCCLLCVPYQSLRRRKKPICNGPSALLATPRAAHACGSCTDPRHERHQRYRSASVSQPVCAQARRLSGKMLTLEVLAAGCSAACAASGALCHTRLCSRSARPPPGPASSSGQPQACLSKICLQPFRPLLVKADLLGFELASVPRVGLVWWECTAQCGRHRVCMPVMFIDLGFAQK